MLSVTIVIFKTLPFKVYALLRVYIVVSNDFAPYRATSYRVCERHILVVSAI